MSIEVLYSGTPEGGILQPTVDVIAIHGLNPWGASEHAGNTWQDKKSGNLWLRDSLPAELPYARILLYSYDSSPAIHTAKERFIYRANTLLERLRIERRQHPKRPLIFISHSLGGILVKQALVNAQLNPRYKEIKDSTFGLVFFGTPHDGPNEDTKVRVGKICVAIAQSLPGNPSNDIMQALEKGTLFSDHLHEHFRQQLEQYQIISFYEGIGNLVPRESAIFGLPGDRENIVGLNASHSDMCRFNLAEKKDKDNYVFVETNVMELCEAAATQAPRFDELLYQEISNSLQSQGPSSRFQNVERAHRETLHWMWEEGQGSPGLADWLKSGRGIFWVAGKPGAGKSTLMKYAFKDPRTKACLAEQHPGTWILIKFFFFEQGERRERDFSQLLRTLLSHLLTHSRDLVSVVSPFYLQCKKEADMSNDIWNEESLMHTLNIIAEQTSTNVRMLMFIDALDECLGDHRKQLDFLLSWVKIADQASHLIKICLASRQLNEIQVRLGRCPSLRIHEWTKHDISTYVTSRLEEVVNDTATCGLQRTLEKALIKEVVRKAQGVFIWVKLVSDDLSQGFESGDTDAELRARLDNIPSELEDLYERIVDKIPTLYLRDTVNYFQILGCATQPLSLEEFCIAAEDPNEAVTCQALDDEKAAAWLGELCSRMRLRLQSRCQGLIQIRNDTLGGFGREYGNARNIVAFLHLTVKQHLFSDRERYGRLVAKAQIADCIDGNISLMAMYLRKLKTGTRYLPAFMRKIQQAKDLPKDVDDNEELEEFEGSDNDGHVSTRQMDLELGEEYDSHYDSNDEMRMQADVDDDDAESVESDYEVLSEQASIYGYFTYARRAPRNKLYPQKPFYDELNRFCKKFDSEWYLQAYISVSQFRWAWWDDVGKESRRKMDRGRLAIFNGLATLMEESLEKEKIPSGMEIPPLMFALEGSMTFKEYDTPHYIRLLFLLLEHGADPNEYYHAPHMIAGSSMWGYFLKAFRFETSVDVSIMISLMETVAEKTDPITLAAGCVNFLNDYESDSFTSTNSNWLREFVGNLIKEGAIKYPMDEETDESPLETAKERGFEYTPHIIFNRALQDMKAWEVWKVNGRREYEKPSCYGKYVIQVEKTNTL